MIALQALNKILQERDFQFILDAGITAEYFTAYDKEFQFIEKHFTKYKAVPDTTTFLDSFPDFSITEVSEPNAYLIDKLREDHLYNKSVPIIEEAVNLYKKDANLAVEYILSNFKTIKTSYGIAGVDIIKDAAQRLEEYKDKQNNKDNWFFSSGFNELDSITNGLQRGEELIVLFARTNQGKSWIAEKMAVSVWQQGFNIGFFSPEMTSASIGYRFDTLHKGFSNYHLVQGKDDKINSGYVTYIKSLPKERTNSFLVTTPLDFDRKPTVTKIKNWVKDNGLHMIVIDGLSYLHDERYRRGDNLTTSLTNISEDLMSISVELRIPIIAVVQANREAAGEEKTSAPSLETIRNSDGISHNASKVFSVRVRNNVLEINVQKQRNGIVGNRLLYSWDINTGNFAYLPNPKANLPGDVNEIAIAANKNEFINEESIF